MKKGLKTTNLSKLETQRFAAMATSMTVKDAAQKLGIAEGTLNNWTYKLRKRLLRERGHVNACLGQKQRSKLLDRVLSQRTSMEPLEEETVED